MGVGVWGGRSEKEEMYVYIQQIHFIVQQKQTQHCKATIPQYIKFFKLLLGEWGTDANGHQIPSLLQAKNVLKFNCGDG